MQPDVTTKYNLGPVQPYVSNAAYIIGPQFNVKTIYGWRKTDPFPDHPTGHALDFMITSKTQGDNIAQYVMDHADQLGVKYLIWNRRSWTPAGGWKTYTATNNPHTDHVHVTFKDAGPWTSNPALARGSFGGVSVDSEGNPVDYDPKYDNCAWKVDFKLFGGCIIEKTQVRALIGGSLMIAGTSVFIIGVIVLMAYGLGKSDAGQAALSYVPGGKLIQGKIRPKRATPEPVVDELEV